MINTPPYPQTLAPVTFTHNSRYGSEGDKYVDPTEMQGAIDRINRHHVDVYHFEYGMVQYMEDQLKLLREEIKETRTFFYYVQRFYPHVHAEFYAAERARERLGVNAVDPIPVGAP